MNSSVWAELAVRKKKWATFEGVFFNFLRAKKIEFFFENIVESFHIFLIFLMILFTAEPLRFFIYISVCCWTFELSLLLNLWDYLLLLNLWDYALDYVSVYCWTFGFYLLLKLWDYLFASEPLDFLYCWTFEIMPWIMYLFDAEALRTFSSKQNHQKSGPLIKRHESEITDISIIPAKI